MDGLRGLPEIFPATLGSEDDRRPRMDIGIGIWSDTGGARYYSMETVQAENNAVLDTFRWEAGLVQFGRQRLIKANNNQWSPRKHAPLERVAPCDG